MRHRQRGFTLVELIIVMVVVGVIAGVLVLQIRPAMQSYLAIRQRANLTSQADAALRRIIAEVHTAVPNSLRFTWAGQNAQCIEFVPTKDGGRYRMAPDTVKNLGNVLSTNGDTTQTFDTLTDVDGSVGRDDVVVVGNINGSDAYDDAKVGIIQSKAVNTLGTGKYTITLQTATAFSPGYEGGRFVVVPKAERAVTYSCMSAGTNPGTGTGTGFIYRVTGYTPSKDAPKSCPAGPAILVAKVSDCNILYHESQGATQQSGYLQLRLGLADGGESVHLTMGAHVENAP